MRSTGWSAPRNASFPDVPTNATAPASPRPAPTCFAKTTCWRARTCAAASASKSRACNPSSSPSNAFGNGDSWQSLRSRFSTFAFGEPEHLLLPLGRNLRPPILCDQFLDSLPRPVQNAQLSPIGGCKPAVNHSRREVLLLAEKRSRLPQLQEISVQASPRKHLDRQ